MCDTTTAVTCVVCGTPLTGTQRRYCSKPCAIKGNTIARRENPERMQRHYERKAEWQRNNRDKANRYKKVETRECEWCGRAIECRADSDTRLCEPCHKLNPREGASSDAQWRECDVCGDAFLWKGQKVSVCGQDCNTHRMKSPLRVAIESKDHSGVIAALRSRSDETEPDCCWEWSGRLNQDGYPVVKFGRNKSVPVHRRIAEVFHGATDGKAVHHRCANRACVNPAHLQVVTHQQNLAEMLQRSAYLSRIAALEDALRDVCSNHPLLSDDERRIAS